MTRNSRRQQVSTRTETEEGTRTQEELLRDLELLLGSYIVKVDEVTVIARRLEERMRQLNLIVDGVAEQNGRLLHENERLRAQRDEHGKRQGSGRK